MLPRQSMDRKRPKPERRRGERTTPSPESIQERLSGIAEAVDQLQSDVEELIHRPNVLPWRPRPGRKTENGD
jgi:hypothetical protein